MPVEPLHVGIDARLFSGKSGGIEQVAIGLVDALSKLSDGDEIYTILAYPKSYEWIEPYVGGRCKVVLATGVKGMPGWKRWGKKWNGLVRAGQHVGGWLARKSLTLSESDGTIEGLGVKVMHFIMQRAFFTDVPSVYHPHDLQHIHLPGFFSRREWQKRDLMLRRFCRQAKVVSVTSQWVKVDLMKQYGLGENKVEVTPITGALGAYGVVSAGEIGAMKGRLGIDRDFVFYPAQTWPHKNHMKLLEAMGILRGRGVKMMLVCSGHQTDYAKEILKKAEELGLSQALKLVGFVSPVEMKSLYASCRCVCVPTLFEAASGPMNEAFMAGAAACCSNVTSLPEQAGDAALVFDPHDANDIAEKLGRLWEDEALRKRLALRGKDRVANLTWERAARAFRDLYRRIGTG